ncbi:hypothetical protein PTKIN_Ptkin08bG0086800 [Pterospermum kingtungense]
MLSKEVAEKTQELSIQGLCLEELRNLEKLLEEGLTHVMETKVLKFHLLQLIPYCFLFKFNVDLHLVDAIFSCENLVDCDLTNDESAFAFQDE